MAYQRGDQFDQYYITPPPPPTDPTNPPHDPPIVPTGGGYTIWNGVFTSPNYARGARGWKIDSDGNAEFQTVSTIFNLSSIFPISNVLQAYYKLEDLTDLWKGNTLTNNNAVTFTPGKIGNGANFGASNANKSLSTVSALTIDGGLMSMSAWVNITTQPSGATSTIVSQYNDASKVLYEILYIDTAGVKTIKFRRGKQGIANNDVTVTFTLTTGNWYHLVLTYDLTNVEGWVNGVSQGTVASAGNGNGSAGTTGFAIGASSYNVASNLLSGMVDEVAVFSKKLTNADVKIIYNGGFGLSSP